MVADKPRISGKEENMVRPVVTLVALLVLIGFTAFGCSKTDEGSTTSRPGGSSSAPAGAIKVRVGVIVPKTGDIATYGDMVEKAVRIAADDARLEGKVAPELIILDNGADQQKTASSAKQLIDTDKVDVIVGPVTTKNSIMAGDIAEAARVPLVTPTATNVEVTRNRKYVFRVCFTDAFQGSTAANFAYDTLGARRAAVLVDSSEPYSMGLGDEFSRIFKQRGGEIASYVAFTAGGDDFGGQVTQMKMKAPDVVFMPTYYEPAAKCVSQARAMGFRTTFVGTDGWDSSKLYELSGGTVKGNYFTTHFSPLEERPVVKMFVQNFRAAYGVDPDALAALGYDAAMVVFDAVKRAGRADRQAITDALATTTDFEGVTGKFSIDANHNAVKSVVILETGDSSSMLKAIVAP